MDTIFAVSSGAPPAAIAVMRLSGGQAVDAATRLAGSLPPPRHAAVRTLRTAPGEAPLDRAIVIVFPGSASATGEDLVELHLHGGRAVVRAVEQALARLPGLRAAEPGEFTRRALLNGRIDLTEAEGLADLLAAETEVQRLAAVRMAGGALRREIAGWTARAVGIAAGIEALLDHADEGDVAEVDALRIGAEAAKLGQEIAELANAPTVERLRDGIRVVLAGPPNAGKSSLLNRLADRDAAIVTPIAGTTRDVIEVPVLREGTAFLLTDTAGLNPDSPDPVEALGVERARAQIDAADIVLWLGATPLAQPDWLWVHSRCDLPDRATIPAGSIAVSAVTGQGISLLWERLMREAAARLPPPDSLALNRRQRTLCLQASAALQESATQPDLVLAAESVRAALRAFDRLTGRADTEAVLDALFARFCIGK